MSKESKKMIVLPPHVSSFEGALSKEDLNGLFFFSNPVRQKNSRTRKNIAYVAVNDLLGKGALSDVNASARHFATQWCREGGLEENLKFCGVNMGSLFFMEFTYFFIGTLKAFHVSKALLEAWGPSHEMTLVDDGTYWSKVFKRTARLRDKSVGLVAVKPDLAVGEKETVSFRGSLRAIVKNMMAIWNIPSAGNLKPGGILYSAAPRYVEPLWKYDQSAPGYYLRTEFSVKASKTIKKDFPHLMPILPSKPGDTAPRAALLQWMKKNRVLETVSEYFDSHPFFIYQGVDFWPMVREDFLQKFKKRILQKGAWVYSVDRWIKTLKPKMIVVDEDVTPFNQALIERANLDQIPTIQIQHGIPEPDNHLIPIRSTQLLVPGEAAKKRMLDMGARSEQVEIAGAPHYEARFRDIPKRQYEEEVYRDLNLPRGTKIVTLITHNFLTEEKPDWIGAIDQPEHIAAILRLACRAVKGLNDVKLVVKLHPRDSNEWFTREVLRNEGMAKDAIVIKHYDSVKLFCGSSLILSGLSTTYYEALLLDKPIFIFDDSGNRRLSFMSEEFLDLAAPEATQERLVKILLDDRLKQERLERQAAEKKSHFLNANQGSVEHFWKLLNEMCQTHSKERYQHA